MTAFIGATGQRRPADGIDRVQDDLRGRADALRDHARDEHHLDPARPQVPGGLRLMSRADQPRSRACSIGASCCCSSRVVASGRSSGCSSTTFIDGLPALELAAVQRPPVDAAGGGRRAARDPRDALPRGAPAPDDRADRRRAPRSTSRSTRRKDRWYNRLLELNIQNLAAVPVDRLRDPRPRVHRPRARHRPRRCSPARSSSRSSCCRP